MATLRKLADELGLLNMTCRHCRKKTNYAPVVDELVKRIIIELVVNGGRVQLNEFGSFFVKRKKAKSMVRDGQTIETKEGLSVKFKLSRRGLELVQEMYDGVKDIWKEKFGL